MATYEYSPREVKIAWSGIEFSGFTKDSFVTITPTDDVFSADVGSDGLAEISYSPDQTGTVMVSLQQGSVTARLLAASVAANTRVSGDLTVIDPSGSIFCFMKGARIMTRAEITRGAVAADNTNDWVFWCEELIYTGTPSGISPDVISFLGGVTSVLGD